MHDNSANSLIELLCTTPLHKLNARGIYAKISCDLRRVSLTYDQTEADPLDDIASLCRGIVIASPEQIDENIPITLPKIVARPFKRFLMQAKMAQRSKIRQKHLCRSSMTEL